MSRMLVLFVLLVALAAVPVKGADDEKPQRLTLDAARTRIGAYLLAEKPQLRLGDDFALVEMTTETIWKRLGVQVFKAKSGLSETATFVIRGNEVHRIGRAFGGDGVGSLAVADLAGDKKPLLVYAFAWGSGEHRSEIAVLDVLAKTPKEVAATPVNYSFNDFRVNGVDDVSVEVFAGKIKVGRLVLEKKEGQANLSIRLEEKLPEAIRKQLRRASVRTRCAGSDGIDLHSPSMPCRRVSR